MCDFFQAVVDQILAERNKQTSATEVCKDLSVCRQKVQDLLIASYRLQHKCQSRDVWKDTGVLDRYNQFFYEVADLVSVVASITPNFKEK